MVFSCLQVADRLTWIGLQILSIWITHIYSTFLLTDPEVFLMLLHNSIRCCTATVKVPLYVIGEGNFTRGRTGGSSWWCWCQCFSCGCRVWSFSLGWLEWWTNVDIDWWIAGWSIDRTVGGMLGKKQSRIVWEQRMTTWMLYHLSVCFFFPICLPFL